MDLSTLYFLCLVMLGSCLATGLVRQYALRYHVVDTPNERSAHQIPTPRGGGVGMVVALLFAIGMAQVAGVLLIPGSSALFGASLLVAVVGFLDDHGYLTVAWRLVSHAVAAGWVLLAIHGCPPIQLLGFALPAGLIANTCAFFYLIWGINLYNFMDGIDGLAALEAISVCSGMVIIYAVAGRWDLAALPLLLLASVLGFLVWNWPPARIFMGDAGSGFLGCLLAALALQAGHQRASFFWSWLILFGVFVVDATYTLLMRALRGERLLQAHSTHAYQHAARRYQSHLTVSMAVVLLNVLWLWPLAYLVGVKGYNGFGLLLIAYLPLIGLTRAFKAGVSVIE